MRRPLRFNAPPDRFAQRAVRLAAGAAILWTTACGSGDGFGTPGDAPTGSLSSSESSEETGSLSFALTTQSGLEFEAFNYVITGPDFTKADGIDVSDSNTVSALVDGIPVASDYSITIQGTSSPPEVAQCSGSATFAITAGAVTDVPVSISCHVQDLGPGAAPVPLPPLVPVTLGLLLLVAGGAAARRTRRG